MVSRPRTREFSTWGCLPGAYEAPTEKGVGIAGAKPIDLMRSIVRDYSRPGDLVCDPFAGSGTTLLAAAMEGRRAVGAEQKQEHYDIATRRLANGYTPTMFAE
jgi:site-specific DNA-methyltransferase (adenine-specific)